MSEQKPRTAVKMTLSSGKVVIIFTPKQSDLNEATREAGLKAGNDNQAYLGIQMQRCLTARLIHSVDGKELGMMEKQDPDIFTIQENAEISKQVTEMAGLDVGNEIQTEIVTL